MMLGYQLEVGKTYKITQEVLLSPSDFPNFDMVGKVTSVDEEYQRRADRRQRESMGGDYE